MNYPNIHALLRERVEQNRGRDVFFVRENDRWTPFSWNRLDEEVTAFAGALLAKSLRKGGGVCILMRNVPEWPVADLGTIIAGGVSVGLYPTNSAEQCAYIINHSDAEFVLVDTASQLEKILRVRESLPKVRTIICLDEKAATGKNGTISYRDFLEVGRGHAEDVQHLLRERAENARLDDTAILVYTSGTTGLPKGAELSHGYILHSADSLKHTIPIDETDRSFSYLPYCHVAERISGLYNRLYSSSPAYFVDDLNRLWEYMLEVKPTVFGSLPRFFEKIHSRIRSDFEKAPDAEREAFEKTLALGRNLSELRQTGAAIPDELADEYRAISGPAIEKVRSYFGGEIKIATSGGAPLPQEIAEFFDAFGIPLLQAYGLTENICVAFNRPDKYRFGTVGPAMPGCEIRIAEDGEIVVRSRMMFGGYYKQPDETAAVIRDGWVHTGDVGELDADGFLKITGRIKELIVTSTGKKVAPALLENMLKENHLVSQAMAYGDNKSYLVALITLNQLETESFARLKGIPFTDFPELTRSEEIKAVVKNIVDGVNARVSSTEAIKKFAVLDRDFSVEADEITPTMKVKRKVVAEKYQSRLDELYG